MKLHKFESFTTIQKSNQEIEEICHDLKIENYTITSKGLVDVDGDVDLSELNLNEIPIKFGIVTGDFDCRQNNLKSLAGSPQKITGDFYCQYNKLTTLQGGPKYVAGSFDCDENELTSLIGAPIEIGDDFSCDDNESLISLNGIPNVIKVNFYCYGTPVDEVWALFKRNVDFLSVFESYNLFQIPGVIDSAALEEIAEHIGQKLPERWTLKNYQVV